MTARDLLLVIAAVLTAAGFYTFHAGLGLIAAGTAVAAAWWFLGDVEYDYEDEDSET